MGGHQADVAEQGACRVLTIDVSSTASSGCCALAHHGVICRIATFFNQIKQCRRVATRYDKLAANYLAFVQLASIRLWLRTNESTP